MIRQIIVILSLCALSWAGVLDTNRIVGGVQADIKDFPHQLGMERYDSFKCGASIISKDWALTAAHCIYDNPNADYFLRAGTSKRELEGDRHEVEKIIMQPKYDHVTDDYDFALMKVKKPFDIDNKSKPIRKIKIADKGNDPSDGKVTVSGWGADDEEIGAPTRYLKKVDIPLVKRIICKEAYAKEDMLVTDRMLCAGYKDYDSCQGDSGGPLIMGDVQVGVVSWAYGCGKEGFAGIYSRIGYPEVRDWIKTNTGV